MSPTRDDLVRAATIIDCEGCIYISSQQTPYKGRNLYHAGKTYQHYFARVSVSMVDDVIVPWLAHTFPLGSLSYKHGIWRWGLASGDTNIFLRQIFPFLKLKQSQAKVALRLCWLKDRLASTSRWGLLGAPTTRAAAQRQFERWNQELKLLHVQRVA